jgi:tellurite resistance protein TehA-like permease
MGQSVDTETERIARAGWLTREIARLYPGSFALVMATGIISNALYLEDHRPLSGALFAINAIAFPWLIAATVIRAVRFPRALWADLIDPRLVFSFFTIVAASDVFGLGLFLRGFGELAVALWLFALVLWFCLIYLSFGVLIFLNTAHRANVVHAAG